MYLFLLKTKQNKKNTFEWYCTKNVMVHCTFTLKKNKIALY